MKYTSGFLPTVLTLALLALTAGCTPKNKHPRQVHEPKREWTPVVTPTDQSIRADSFDDYALEPSYQLLKKPGADLVNGILKPLSAFVLNSRFIEVPRYRTKHMTEMIHVFNQAFLVEIERPNTSPEFTAIKKAYFDTVFSGCSGDLRRDCVNNGIFSNDARHTRIMARLAEELDDELETFLKKHETPARCVAESEPCRALLEQRYRILAMGNLKRNNAGDSEYAFAYLKYARAFALLVDYDRAKGEAGDSVSTGYIAEVNSKIFETLIARYQPKSMADPEFKAFVENFNPWIYSQKQADTFQYGTKIMFEFGARCCLYSDKEKRNLSEAVKQAIDESQKDSDSFGPSFRQMIEGIKAKFSYRMFANLGMESTIRDLERPDSKFYNEYFLVVDRLFRGHLSSSEVEMVLRNTPPERTQAELPKVISTYLKVYLLHMVVETNVFMASIYNSNIASDKVFEEATTRSRELTSRWHTIQSQIELLERVMGSYFKGNNLSSEAFANTTRLIKGVNRNIHYISVFPNMIVMTHFLSKMKGKIVVNTWWGRIDIDANTILDAFFDGTITSPWFRFGKDPEPLDRQMLLYSWEYMLSTESLSAFSAKDETLEAGDEREKFFSLVFSKYIDDNIHSLRKKITDFERNTDGEHSMGSLRAVCDYELNGGRVPPGLKISFLDLPRYTYSGLGDNSINGLLNQMFSTPRMIFQSMREDLEFRLTFIKVMIDIVEADLLRSGKIKAKGEKHKDLETAHALLAEIEGLKLQIAKRFAQSHKRHFECSLRLQEIERRRTNRLYEEERAHLSQVFDLIKPLVGITDRAELDARIQEINQKHFRAEGSGYRFDSLHGLTYRMSKYDLLMRMKRRIESDIFTDLTPDEARLYAASNGEYLKPRNVSVFLPDGLERDAMVARQTANTIFVNGASEADREAFIRQGMQALNGKSGAFVEWQGQRATDKGLFNYLSSLTEFYLLGPVREGDMVHQVSAEDVASAYIQVIASAGMDEMDVKNSLEFGDDGRYERTFFKGRLFEENGAHLPFFYQLMSSIHDRSMLNLERPSGPGREALDYAQTLNNLRSFVFAPSSWVAESVRTHYGDRAHGIFHRVGALYAHLEAIEKQNGDVTRLNPRLSLPLYLQDGQPVFWSAGSAPLVDKQRRNDQRILLDDFSRRTGNFYGTREKVTLQ